MDNIRKQRLKTIVRPITWEEENIHNLRNSRSPGLCRAIDLIGYVSKTNPSTPRFKARVHEIRTRDGEIVEEVNLATTITNRSIERKYTLSK